MYRKKFEKYLNYATKLFTKDRLLWKSKEYDHGN